MGNRQDTDRRPRQHQRRAQPPERGKSGMMLPTGEEQNTQHVCHPQRYIATPSAAHAAPAAVVDQWRVCTMYSESTSSTHTDDPFTSTKIVDKGQRAPLNTK